jgi:uncharacterized protein YjbI with pentapeptide repeats
MLLFSIPEISVVGLFVGLLTFVFEAYRSWNARFLDCADQINNSHNSVAQLSSAIQLRNYISNRFLFFISHKKHALALLCSILKDNKKSSNLQKTLGDGLSFVDKAHGLDLQGAHLHGVCIKPQCRIDYEVSRDVKKNIRSVDLRNTDLYHANIAESTICNVVFDSAHFNGAILCGTRFHNCSLKNVDFSGADLSGVRFYSCDLQGAKFSGAKRLSTVTVYANEKDERTPETPVSLLKFLDEDGYFAEFKKEPVYSEQVPDMTVFVSKLGTMSAQQEAYYLGIKSDLCEKYKDSQLKFKTIERISYSESGQLTMMHHTIEQCKGFIVFAFSHLEINKGRVRKDKKDEMEELADANYSSPWLQIETAFARSMGLPCLIVAEDDKLKRNGVFDEAIVNADPNMFYVIYKGLFTKDDYAIIEKWKNAVESNQ